MYTTKTDKSLHRSLLDIRFYNQGGSVVRDIFMLYNLLLCCKNDRKNKAVTVYAFNFSYEQLYLSDIRFYVCTYITCRCTCYVRTHITVLIANDGTGSVEKQKNLSPLKISQYSSANERRGK